MVVWKEECEKMDIVYIVGNGSIDDNLELRNSLRSIEKFGRNVGRVIVAGIPPEFLSDAVIKLRVLDKYPYKHSNILTCIENVVKTGLVHGDFLYSSDDHFYVKPTDFDNYPVYKKADELRKNVAYSDQYFKYHRSLVDTRLLLQKHNFPICNYSQHCNTHMNADIIKEYDWLLHESYTLKYGVEPTSLIMNVWQTKPNAPKTTMRKDLKVGIEKTVGGLVNLIGDKECFSIGDNSLCGHAVKDFFAKMYPNKSKYEK